MTDDITTRIADIMAKHLICCECGNAAEDWVQNIDHAADKVVTDLGLTEDRHDWHDDAVRPNLTRYVTDWVGYPRTDGET
jgi:hypothetical protein